jgi:very-short-patch-repair endonuclease
VKPRTSVIRAIERLAAEQHGVFGRAQALELGATRHIIAGSVASGAWPRVLPSVHRVDAVPVSSEQAAMAAVLWSAPDGLVSHQAAARLWQMDGEWGTRVHVLLPSSRSLRSPLVTLHHTTELIPADIGALGPIRLTSPLRTAIDLAGELDEDDLELAVESGLRRRLFSLGQLRWRADALLGTGRTGSSRLRRLLERRDLGRTESGWELRTSQVLERAGLGRPVRQHEVRVRGRLAARVDLAYPDARIALEYDSDRWHSGVARRHADAERRNRLRALGWTVIEVTPSSLRHTDALVALVATALAA